MPRASTKTTLSDKLEDELPLACRGIEDALGCNSIAAVHVICARVFEVYTNEADASLVQHFGSAQLTLEMAAW